MLNQAGGRVLFGVEPGTGELRGQQVGAKTLDDLANELALIEPRVVPTIHLAETDGGRQIIVVTVGPGTESASGRRATCPHSASATI